VELGGEDLAAVEREEQGVATGTRSSPVVGVLVGAGVVAQAGAAGDGGFEGGGRVVGEGRAWGGFACLAGVDGWGLFTGAVKPLKL
jgi:hypothetical protein